MNYTDAHCHITPTSPCPDIITGRICNAGTQTEWDKFDTFCDDKNYACIGIHPWHIATITPDWESEMRMRMRQNTCLMVGEIGLDKYHQNMAAQEKIFISQLTLAAEFGRPGHVHCVGAWDKMLHIFKELRKNMPPVVVMHAFNSDAQLISQIAEQYNVYFSYSVPTDPKAIARIAATPIQRLLIESDATNIDDEVQIIKSATDTIANIMGYNLDEFSNQIFQNFQGVTSYARPID